MSSTSSTVQDDFKLLGIRWNQHAGSKAEFDYVEVVDGKQDEAAARAASFADLLLLGVSAKTAERAVSAKGTWVSAYASPKNAPPGLVANDDGLSPLIRKFSAVAARAPTEWLGNYFAESLEAFFLRGTPTEQRQIVTITKNTILDELERLQAEKGPLQFHERIGRWSGALIRLLDGTTYTDGSVDALTEIKAGFLKAATEVLDTTGRDATRARVSADLLYQAKSAAQAASAEGLKDLNSRGPRF